MTNFWLLNLTLGVLVIFAVALMRGWLSRRALLVGPLRDTGLWTGDLMVGFLITLLGLVALRPVLESFDLLLPQDLGQTVSTPPQDALESTANEAAPLNGEPADLQSLTAGQHLLRALVSQVMTQVPAVFFVLWRVGGTRSQLRQFGFLPCHVRTECATAIGGLVVAIPIVMWLAMVSVKIGDLIGATQPPPIGHSLLRTMTTSDSAIATAGLIVSSVIVASVLEEVLFRGLLQSALFDLFNGSRRWLIVLIAAFAFAVIHSGSVPWQALPGLAALGVILGWLYERTGSLMPCMLVHAGFNLFNVILALVVTQASRT